MWHPVFSGECLFHIPPLSLCHIFPLCHISLMLVLFLSVVLGLLWRVLVPYYDHVALFLSIVVLGPHCNHATMPLCHIFFLFNHLPFLLIFHHQNHQSLPPKQTTMAPKKAQPGPSGAPSKSGRQRTLTNKQQQIGKIC